MKLFGLEKKKTCSKCGSVKDESEYSWSIRGFKRHSVCKPCRASERLDYYRRNVDCGESDPMILTFDHVLGNKKMNVSQMVNQGYSIDAIKSEIAKCVVRCANCHMRAEEIRRGTAYF